MEIYINFTSIHKSLYMRKFYLLVLITIVLISCRNTNSNKEKQHKISKPAHSQNKINRERIEGRWGPLKDTGASFYIDKREIFYYDATAYTKYSLLNNTIKIDNGYEGQLKMIGNDTLIMIGVSEYKGSIDTFHRCN